MSATETPIFGTTKDGMFAARIGDTTYAMRPTTRGGFFIRQTFSSSPKPIEELTDKDFFGAMGDPADESAFRAEMADIVEHRRQLAALDRKQLSRTIRTPWGEADSATQYTDGVIFFGTPGHGGFRVYAKANALIPSELRNKDGWYEEDVEWAKVAYALPLAFTAREVRQATKTIMNTLPDEYEAITGTVLDPSQSVTKAKRLFEQKHANDYVVTSAIRSKEHAGMVEVHATVGGERSRWEAGRDITVEDRKFLVPSSEYEAPRQFGFVIDLARHEEIEKPQAVAALR